MSPGAPERQPRSRARLVLARRGLAFVAFAVWLGGLTFYALVVVPVGTQVLGGPVAQGFVTQAVTVRLNLVALAALAALAWNAFVLRERRPIVGTWAVMLAAQAVLFALHPSLDRLLDPATRTVVDHARFYATHRGYLLVTTAQWIAGFVHMGLVLAAWRAADRGERPR
jgi:hypothetical protein